MGLQVLIPDRVLGGAAHRGNGRVASVVLDPHQRGLADLAGSGTQVGHDPDRQPRIKEGRALGAAGALEPLDLIADPASRAGRVITVQWHAQSLIWPRLIWPQTAGRRVPGRRSALLCYGRGEPLSSLGEVFP